MQTNLQSEMNGQVHLADRHERMIACAIHLSSLLNFFLPLVGALVAIVGLGWLGGESEFVKGNVRQALAFQLAYFVVGLTFLSTLVGNLFCLPILPFAVVFGLTCSLMAALDAWEGKAVRYPPHLAARDLNRQHNRRRLMAMTARHACVPQKAPNPPPYRSLSSDTGGTGGFFWFSPKIIAE